MDKIIELIKIKPNITQRELSEKIGLSFSGVKYNITKLKKQGIIKRVGSDKTGYWEILKI